MTEQEAIRKIRRVGHAARSLKLGAESISASTEQLVEALRHDCLEPEDLNLLVAEVNSLLSQLQSLQEAANEAAKDVACSLVEGV